MKDELKLTPTQAIGVALSCTPAAKDETMYQCQKEAVDIIDHLYRMGFSVILTDSIQGPQED